MCVCVCVWRDSISAFSVTQWLNWVLSATVKRCHHIQLQLQLLGDGYRKCNDDVLYVLVGGLQVIKKNAREREEERNEPEVIDSQMLWLLMHTLRRNAARRVSCCCFCFFCCAMLCIYWPMCHAFMPHRIYFYPRCSGFLTPNIVVKFPWWCLYWV